MKDESATPQSTIHKSEYGVWIRTHHTVGGVRSLFYYETREDAENGRNCYGYDHFYPYKYSV